MKKVLIRETAIFAVLLVVLALAIHPDLLHTPTERFSRMVDARNYYHPFLYTFLVYAVLFIIRFIVKKVFSLTRKLKRSS